MPLGRLLLHLRTKYGHGLRCAYYRDVVRPRILQTPPVADTADRACEIHILTCAGDWLNAMWALKSFYWASGRSWALAIHDDGTLPDLARDAFANHFPNARLVTRAEADREAARRLRDFPRMRQFRDTNHLAPKVIDFPAFLESDRMLVIDSDLLFFAAPDALLARIEGADHRFNVFNADVESAYTVKPAAVQAAFGFALVERFNSGLGLAHRASLRLDWLEEFLALPGLAEGHFWRIEQTLYALLSSRYGVELLPEDYAVYLTRGLGRRPARHYVGRVRHLMYGEGMRALSRRGFLESAPATASGTSRWAAG